MRQKLVGEVLEQVTQYHENQEGNYVNEMSTTTDDCEFCKTSFGDLCCGCRFNWNSQTVQLFHCDREILAAQITKLENLAEELNPGAVISTGIFNPGAEGIDHLGQDVSWE